MKLLATRIALLLLIASLAYNAGAVWSYWAQRDDTNVEQVSPEGTLTLPSTDLSPREVVEIQVSALGRCTQSQRDLWQCYAFASPGNRQVTGPIDRFTRMLLSPTFEPLVQASAVVIGSEHVRGDSATVLVTVTDRDRQVCSFRFYLTRQTENPYPDCWMTDGVVVVQPREPAEPQHLTEV